MLWLSLLYSGLAVNIVAAWLQLMWSQAKILEGNFVIPKELRMGFTEKTRDKP